jgi:PPOX class probable F420-dependent enzyme
MDERLSQFERKSYMNLETFRRTGEGVQTPVWFVQEAESFYVRTLAESGKVKRIRACSAVQIAPCEVNGGVIGTWVTAAAVEVHDTDLAVRVARLLEDKYGVTQVRAFAAASSLRGHRYTILHITVQ